MKTLTATALVAAIALIPAVGQAAGTKKMHRMPRVEPRAIQSAPVVGPSGSSVYGNSANSPDGSNSAPGNPNGRTNGGGGGMT